MKSFTALLLAAALALGAVSCRKSARRRRSTRRRSSSSGFDGMDPELTEQWMAAGQLPNLARLARAGRVLPPRDEPFAGVPHLVGVVRDRLQRGQAQHLRLPGAGPEDLHAGPRHRQGRSRRSSCSTTCPSRGR
ncbi:MAG: hypothetical protein MZV64_28435 [Ignavibacteriales bacterium]|nr:hypothetical protein [Ignavibacteriales bacterium]